MIVAERPNAIATTVSVDMDAVIGGGISVNSWVNLCR